MRTHMCQVDEPDTCTVERNAGVIGNRAVTREPPRSPGSSDHVPRTSATHVLTTVVPVPGTTGPVVASPTPSSSIVRTTSSPSLTNRMSTFLARPWVLRDGLAVVVEDPFVPRLAGDCGVGGKPLLADSAEERRHAVVVVLAPFLERVMMAAGTLEPQAEE